MPLTNLVIISYLARCQKCDCAIQTTGDCGAGSGTGGGNCLDLVQDVSDCAITIVSVANLAESVNIILFYIIRQITLPQHCVLVCNAEQYITMSLMHVLVSLVSTLHWMLYDKH